MSIRSRAGRPQATPVPSCAVSEDAPRRVWPEVMLVEEAADYLRTTTRSLRRLAREGKVPARKVGGEWRFHRLALEDYFRQPQPLGDLDDDADDRDDEQD